MMGDRLHACLVIGIIGFAASGCSDAAPVYNVAFATELSFPGDLPHELGSPSAISRADSLCADAASSAGLEGTFVAFLSSRLEQTHAIDRIPPVGPWVDLRGRQLFANRDFVAYLPETPFSVTADGSFRTDAVWTGSIEGGLASGFDCNGWVSRDVADRGTTGITSLTNSAWIDAGISGCQEEKGLYCFQTDLPESN